MLILILSGFEFLCDSVEDVRDVQFFNGVYYVCDGKRGCIWKYDQKGRFIGRIGKKGDAPEELSIPYSIFCTDRGILIGSLGKLSIFSQSGKFKCSKGIPPLFPYKVLWKDTIVYALIFGPEKNFFILNDKLEKLKSYSILFGERYKKYREEYPRAFSPRVFCVYKNKIVFYNQFRNTLEFFTMDGEKVKEIKLRVPGWSPPPIEKIGGSALFVNNPSTLIKSFNDKIYLILLDLWSYEWKSRKEIEGPVEYIIVEVSNGKTDVKRTGIFYDNEQQLKIHRIIQKEGDLFLLYSSLRKEGYVIGECRKK